VNDMAKILPKPTRTISDLSDDERRVIRARHFGWESASPALLALVFSVPVQAINSVLKQPFAAPGKCRSPCASGKPSRAASRFLDILMERQVMPHREISPDASGEVVA